MTESNLRTIEFSLCSINFGLARIIMALEDEGVDVSRLKKGFEKDIENIRENEKRFNKLNR